MSLEVLADLNYPITAKSIAQLMVNIQQLNIIDAGLNDPLQRALGIYLHTIDLYVKSAGKFDYRGKAGRERLKQDARTFAQTDSIMHRHGDLAAAHLSVDWSDTQIRCMGASLPLLPTKVNDLLAACSDMQGLSILEEKRLGLFMDICGKKSPA